VDAARMDHLSCYGYERKTSPNIDTLAKEGIVFYNTIVAAPFTLPSVASLFTSQYPHSHGVRDHPDIGNCVLDNRHITMAEILAKEGYKTAIFHEHPYFTPAFGLCQGFGTAVYDPSEITDYTKNITSTVNKWLIANVKNNFFIYIQFIDPHYPYSPPYPYNEMFNTVNAEEFDKKFNNPEKYGGRLFFHTKSILSDQEIYYAIALYDGEIAYADYKVGMVLNQLKDLGLDKNTLVILTSDHGESLGENNLYFCHDFHLKDALVKVPLIIKFPDKISSKQINIKEQVRNIDILPTILDILKIKISKKWGMEGVSFLPLILGKKWNPLYAFAESCSYRGQKFCSDISMEEQSFYIKGIKGKHRMIRTNKWKLILIPKEDKNVFELYNLEDDPKETKNLVTTEKHIFGILKTKLIKWSNEEKYAETRGKHFLGDDIKQRLKSLGYLE